jgi:uncharacterized protein YbdZ (MbtH family)
MLYSLTLYRKCKNIILFLILSDHETRSPIQTQDIDLRVLDNRTLRVVLGPQKDEVPAVWRKLHNEERRIFLVLPGTVIMT